MPIKGDFISFSYNGVHSTELGIVHVTSSDRYADALLPVIQDKTVQVPGSDGTYFFGSYYTQRQFILNVAFDNVSEDQIRLARKVFGDRQSHPLVFDEEPYKVYYAKVTGMPQYNYIPFNNQEEDKITRPRIYKGEGTINFICYDPFAHTPNNCKYLDQYVVNGINTPWYKYDNKFIAQNITRSEFNANKTLYWYQSNGSWVQCTAQSTFNSNLTYYTIEWNLSANLLSTKGNYDSYDSNLHRFMLYNPGDVEADFKLIIPIGAKFSGIKVSNNEDLESHTLNFNAEPSSVPVKGNDTYLLFNSKTNLVEGLIKDQNNKFIRTGNLYNEKIGDGHWFRIPVNQGNKIWYFTLNDYNGGNPTLEYDYLYF